MAKQKIETVDITPSWRGILPGLIMLIENGTFEGQKIAREELNRMAALADKQVQESR